MRIPIKYNLRNLLARKSTSALTASGIALAVLIFVALSSLVEGMQSAINRAGSPGNLLVMNQGAISMPTSLLDAASIQEIKAQAEFARNAADEALVSEELMVEDVIPLEKIDQPLSAPIRGVRPLALQVHDDVKVIQGSFPQANGEVMLGRKVAEHIGPQAAVGKQLKIGVRQWTITGIFSANGSLIESEIWADLENLAAATRKSKISILVGKLAAGASPAALAQRLNDLPRLGVRAISETDYYQRQNQDARRIWFMTMVVSLILGLAAAFGGMNTMYAAIAARTHEIGILKALGFSRLGILISFLLECLLLALAGGIVGCLVVFLLNGLPVRAMLNGQFMEVTFLTTSPVLLQGLALSAFIGIAGGLFPSLKASNMEVIESIRTH
jgi:ABC-type antimicrobial peptide transport system permease subunit